MQKHVPLYTDRVAPWYNVITILVYHDDAESHEREGECSTFFHGQVTRSYFWKGNALCEKDIQKQQLS